MSLWIIPSWVPLVFGIIELIGNIASFVRPWLTALTIFEIACITTNCHVEYKEELLVEWCISICLSGPWVAQFFWELTKLEHVFSFNTKNLFSINKSLDGILFPFKFIGVEVIT